MEEEGTDEVSCAEKTVCLWLKLLLPLQPTRLEIRVKEEGPFGNTNRFLTHKGRGSMGELPAVNTYPYCTSHHT